MYKFNTKVRAAGSGIIRRECDGCADSHKDVYMKRYDDLTTYNAHQDLTWKWRGDDGFHSKFDLFSSLNDALTGTNPWTYCDGDDAFVGFPRNCGPSGNVGSNWNPHKPNVRFSVWQPTIYEADAEWEVIYATGDYGTKLTDKSTFNAFARESAMGIFRRECTPNSCKADFRDIYLRRYEPLTNYDPYEDLMVKWRGDAGFHEKFDIFSSFEDAISGSNPWMTCNGNDNGVGFPRDCAPSTSTKQSGQWISMGKDGGVKLNYRWSILKLGTTSQVGLDWATLPCPKPLFPEPEEEGELQKLVFDDPSTSQLEDYWLHPCDCLNPTTWGTGLPADASTFEGIPAGSKGVFVPPPYLIVSGQFACPSRQLLPGAAGVHFKTEAESGESVDCQERCQGEANCTFYWSGTSHGADTCRLFRGCDSLVREFGMEGDLMAFPRTAGCAVSNPEACWKTTMRRSFLIQTEGTSPALSRPPAVLNQGGTLNFKALSSSTLNLGTGYDETLSDLSKIRMSGFDHRYSGQGYFRGVSGIATATVNNLNPHKDYKYDIKMEAFDKAMDINNKFSVNHGSQTSIQLKSSRRRRGYQASGTIKATPRGEIMFEFEAVDFPLNAYVSKSGQGSTASRNCRRRYQITSCNCYAVNGKCAGAKIGTDGTCTAYGNKDVSGVNQYTNPSVEAHAYCVALTFQQGIQYVTSSGPSFSWLQTGAAGANGTLAEDIQLTGVSEDEDEDEDDGETAAEIDHEGKVSDEDDDLTPEDEEPEEKTKDEEEQDDSLMDDDEDTEDEVMGEEGLEDSQGAQDSPELSNASLVGAAETQGEKGGKICCSRRRRRRRRRSRRRRSRRRRHSRRRRSRRRRTLPGNVYASCPSGYKVLSCTCYQDSFSELVHGQTVSHHCKKIWKDTNNERCYAEGGYAQAICSKMQSPVATAWTIKESSKTTVKDDENTYVSTKCNSGYQMTGCWCMAYSGGKDHCNRVRMDVAGECRVHPGNLRGTHNVQLRAQAMCVKLLTSYMTVSEIKLTLQGSSLTETGSAVTSGFSPDPFSFIHIHLYQQCDALLLMGGVGVEHCSRPLYRKSDSHVWMGKTPLPESFAHGRQLTASCWRERFTAFRSGVKTSAETLQCINGEWINSLKKKELDGFSCESCVTVAGSGFQKFRKRKEQELYYFNKLAFQVYSELGSVSETSNILPKYCLTTPNRRRAYLSNRFNLENKEACPEIMSMEVVGSADPEDRLMRVMASDNTNGDCMQVGKNGNFPSLFRYPCDQDKSEQLINPMALPSLIWSMHQQFESSAQHVHLAYSSFCGAHGALSSLAFQQIFAGESRRRTNRKISECHFAPVIRFGTFVATGIIYDKTNGDWPNWNTLLADNPVLCPPGEALTGFKLESGSNKYMFECSRIGGLGIQYEYFSAQVEVTKFDHVRNNWLGAIRMLKVDCGENALLSGFHFEFSEGGRWARSKYTCSKAGGAPVVMEPSTTIESRFHSAEGLFCPKFRDLTTGRYRYENTAASGETLTFQEDGRWCIGNSCSKKIGGENPIGAILEQFEVANVTDFDGEFEAKGVPDMSAGSGGLAAQLKLLKPPKRPAQPPKPKLQDFKAEQPKYSEECLDYEDLWKKVIETTKGEDDEPVTEEAKLEPDEGTVDEELVDYHPCAVAAGAGGVFGKIAGQSGKLAPANMLYSDWNECMQGDINRDLYVAHWDFAGALHGIFTDLVEKIAGMVCSLPPDLEIAPLGAGIQVQPGKHCDKFSMLATFLGEFPYDFMEAANSYAVENEGFMACNPFQVGFSRIFCDIHCVRDAMIRGDRTIIRNLEKATKISNDNMKKMVEWSTEANRVETEYLDKKIDHSLKVTTLHLQTILAHVEPKEQLLSVASSTEAMLQEMQGLAQAASSGPRKRLANSALKRFLDSAQLLESTGNLTSKAQRAGEFQSQVVSLYQSLQSSGDGVSKAEVVAKQVAREVEKLQHDLHKQQQVLGVYRHQSRKAKEDAKSWKSSEAAVTLDHLWWKIRNKLDQHLDEAEEEVARYRATFKHLQEYEGCKTGLKDLFGSYAKSMKRMRKNHHKLHSLWRETSNLIGELASVIQDGDLFSKFLADEGCDSTLAMQTLKQAAVAFQGMSLLVHRFEVAGMKKPDISTLKMAAQVVKDSYAKALDSCGSYSAKMNATSLRH